MVIRILLCAVALMVHQPGVAVTAAEEAVTLEFIGHASFLVTAPDGTRVVTDPYRNESAPIGYGKYPGDIEAEVVTISHFHPDHCNSKAINGNPQVLSIPGGMQPGIPQQAGMVNITAYKGDHGDPQDITNLNAVFVFEIGGVKIVHMGAEAFVTQPDIEAALQDVDVVLLPGCGDDDEDDHPIEQQVAQMRQFNARTIILIHYSLDPKRRFFGTATAEELLSRLSSDITVVNTGNKLTLTPDMPEQVVVMAPSALQKQQ